MKPWKLDPLVTPRRGKSLPGSRDGVVYSSLGSGWVFIHSPVPESRCMVDVLAPGLRCELRTLYRKKYDLGVIVRGLLAVATSH